MIIAEIYLDAKAVLCLDEYRIKVEKYSILDKLFSILFRAKTLPEFVVTITGPDEE